MKKSILHFVAILLIILSSSLLFISCKSKQIPMPEPIVINHNKEIISTEKEIINQPINNNTVIPVIASNTNNREFDSLVNSKVDEILNKLNYKNQSGDNSLQVKYNALLRQLDIISKVGQTSNKQNSNSDKQIIEIPVIKRISYAVIQPLTKLQKLLIALGAGFTCFFSIKYIIRFVSFVKGVTV